MPLAAASVAALFIASAVATSKAKAEDNKVDRMETTEEGCDAIVVQDGETHRKKCFVSEKRYYCHFLFCPYSFSFFSLPQIRGSICY